jgi:hypothetical protein
VITYESIFLSLKSAIEYIDRGLDTTSAVCHKRHADIYDSDFFYSPTAPNGILRDAKALISSSVVFAAAARQRS